MYQYLQLNSLMNHSHDTLGLVSEYRLGEDGNEGIICFWFFGSEFRYKNRPTISELKSLGAFIV